MERIEVTVPVLLLDSTLYAGEMIFLERTVWDSARNVGVSI